MAPWHHSPRWKTKPLTNNDRAWLHLRQRRWQERSIFPSCHLLVQQNSSLLLQGCFSCGIRFLFFAAPFSQAQHDCPRPSHCQLLAHSAMSPPQTARFRTNHWGRQYQVTEVVNDQINHASNCECLCRGWCLCPNIQIFQTRKVLFQSVFPRSQAYSIRNWSQRMHLG